MAGSPQHASLVANVVTTMTFDKDFAQVEILNVDGAAEVYATADGTTPVVGATGSYVLPAAIGSLELTPRDDGAAHSGVTVVKLISTGTPKVSVRGL